MTVTQSASRHLFTMMSLSSHRVCASQNVMSAACRYFNISPAFRTPPTSAKETSSSPVSDVDGTAAKQPSSSRTVLGGHPRVRTRPPNIPPTSLSRQKLATRDRGPASKEETQTDFSKMNVLGNTAIPATSVDICAWDGFVLDSGLRVGEGDGVMMVGSEAFVWRPWMSGTASGEGMKELVHGTTLKTGKNESERTGGVVNAKGQFEVADEAWGLFRSLWPKPDLLIIGTGPTIRPLAPATRQCLQDLGLRIEVLDTRNAASQFNMLATERGVNEIAATLVPIGFGRKE